MQNIDATAWTSLLLGLFLLGSAIGELRRPGLWRGMLLEVEQSSALQLTLGIIELALGAAVYLANPWNPQDWLAAFMTIIGGLMIIEAVIFLAIADLYLRFWLPRIGTNWRGWAVVSFLIGLWLALAGLHRFI
ncbi:MAG: hypothetical protein KDE67_11045 [Sphingobium sp.]|nr:hypothetical protein [Sphingobium sp.]MCP5399840.1 hypothetical protein [Sphingomonas sp.]